MFYGAGAATIAAIFENCNRVNVNASMFDFTSRGLVITGNTAVDHYLVSLLAANCNVGYGTNFSSGGSLGSHVNVVQVN